MAKLIDADMLLELYDMGEELEEYAGVLSVPIPVIRQNIKDMPTVDAVEVVRCKDCRYCLHDAHGIWCFNDYEHNLQPDDFCSYGERKDNA